MASIHLDSIPLKDRQRIRRQLSEFAQRLKVAREASGLTQEALAEIVDTTPGYIRRVENGHDTPSLLMFLRIAGVLKLKVSLKS